MRKPTHMLYLLAYASVSFSMWCAADNIGGDSTISYEYDALGRVTKITDHDDWVIDYGYMSDGQKSQIKVTEPSNDQVMYHVAYLYDKALRLEYVSEPLLGLTSPWIAKLGYDDNGNRETLTYYRDGTLGGNTTTLNYTYNRDNRLTAYSTTGGVTFSLSNTTVDGLGRLIEADETLTKPDSSTVSHSHDYAYDMRSQLLSADITNIGGSTWSAEYTYDEAGNVTEETVAGTNKSFTYDGDLMTAKGNDSLTWDENGRMITGVTSSLTYNWEGKLQSGSAGGDSIELKYAPGFDRIYKESTVSQTTTKSKFIVDPTGDLSLILLEIDPDETDPNDAIRKTWIYANSQTIAQHDGNYDDSIYFYLHDRLGSTRQIIDTDANVKNKYTYQPFGESFSSEQAENVSNDFKFTGQYFDDEIEQYYLRARQLDLVVYRFTARDPYSGSFNNPMELHRYLYCLNDPVDQIDPSGEFLGMLFTAKLVKYMRAKTAVAGSMAMTYAERVVGALNMAYLRLSLLVDRMFGAVNSVWPSAGNGPQTINNINYSVHALQRMAPVGHGGRGVPPSVVENAILYGEIAAGHTANTARYVFENVEVVMNTLTNTVITVIKTGH